MPLSFTAVASFVADMFSAYWMPNDEVCTYHILILSMVQPISNSD